MSGFTENEPVSRAALWFGLLGGGVAWTAHLMFAYVAAEFGCVSEFGRRSHLGIALVAWLEIGLTIVTATVAAAAAAVAYQCRQRLHAVSPNVAANELIVTKYVAAQYIARTGIIAGWLFFFVILFESIPIFFYLRQC